MKQNKNGLRWNSFVLLTVFQIFKMSTFFSDNIQIKTPFCDFFIRISNTFMTPVIMNL